MGRIAFVSNREDDNSAFSRKDDFRWQAIIQAIDSLIKQESWRGHTFLIPVFTKFDRYVMKLAEDCGNPVEFYFPSEDWGMTKLPHNDTERIKRLRAYYPAHIIQGNMNRIEGMIQSANGVVVLRSESTLGGLEKCLTNKKVLTMDANKIVNQTVVTH